MGALAPVASQAQPLPGDSAGLQLACSVTTSEEIRLGSIEGDEDYIFGQIADIAVARDGSIYVADLHPQSVRRFDAQGRFVERVGRVGEGPGEYASIVGMGIIDGRQIAVWDYGTRRITVYDSAGDYERAVRVPGGLATRDGFHVDRNGGFYVKTFSEPPRMATDGRLTGVRFGFLAMSANGVVLDTIHLPAVEETFLVPTPQGTLRPFPTNDLWALNPSGRITRYSSEWHALELSDGDAGAVLALADLPPVRLEPEERREWEAVARFSERATGRSFPPVPSTKPPFQSMWVDADGRIWLRRHVRAAKRDLPETVETRSRLRRPNVTWLEDGVFDLYSPAGRYLGCVALPWTVRPRVASGSHVWGTERGAFDEEYVVRWRLHGLR